MTWTNLPVHTLFEENESKPFDLRERKRIVPVSDDSYNQVDQSISRVTSSKSEALNFEPRTNLPVVEEEPAEWIGVKGELEGLPFLLFWTGVWVEEGEKSEHMRSWALELEGKLGVDKEGSAKALAFSTIKEWKW